MFLPRRHDVAKGCGSFFPVMLPWQSNPAFSILRLLRLLFSFSLQSRKSEDRGGCGRQLQWSPSRKVRLSCVQGVNLCGDINPCQSLKDPVSAWQLVTMWIIYNKTTYWIITTLLCFCYLVWCQSSQVGCFSPTFVCRQARFGHL